MKADGAQTADSKAFPQKGGFLWHLVPMEAVVQDANHWAHEHTASDPGSQPGGQTESGAEPSSPLQ